MFLKVILKVNVEGLLNWFLKGNFERSFWKVNAKVSVKCISKTFLKVSLTVNVEGVLYAMLKGNFWYVILLSKIQVGAQLS